MNNNNYKSAMDNIKISDNFVENTLEILNNHQSETKKQKSKKKYKLAIIIPIAAIVFGLSVCAVNGTSLLKTFFTDYIEFFEGKTQTILAQDIENGVKFTIYEAVGDQTDTIFTYKFTKEDGSAFDGITIPDKFSFEGDFFDGYAFGTENSMQNNNKTIAGYAKLTIKSSIQDTVNISIKNLVKEDKGIMPVDINLKELYENPNQNNIQLVPAISKSILIDKVYFENGKLFISIINNEYISDYFKRYSSARIAYLKNLKTEELIYLNNDFQSFNINDPEMLAYLKPYVYYSKIEDSVIGEWNVGVKFDTLIDNKIKDVNAVIEKGGIKFIINKISLSITKVKINGCFEKEDGKFSTLYEDNIIDDNVWSNTNNYLLFKDGSKIKIYYSGGGYSNTDDFSKISMGFTTTEIDYTFDTKKYFERLLNHNINNPIFGETQFINPSDVAAVIIDGVEIPIK